MSLIVGIDEVGRGCWAGPLVAAAVLLDKPITGLKDSKLLSKKTLKLLAAKIKEGALAWSLGWVDAKTVDAIGLTKATAMAMELALAGISRPFDEIVIDGNFNYLRHQPKARTLVKADSLIPAVSAASILAKVARDEHMIAAAKKFPLYSFEQHVGYGTALHYESIKRHGLCELHRLSYKPVKNFLTLT